MPPPTAQAVAPAGTKPPTFFQRQRASGKNFPPCCPFFKHDISGEIPADMQTTVRKAFYVWMGVNICLVYQFICASCALGLNVDSKVISWFLAVIFAILGSPLAFILWYLRLYNAAAYNSAMAYFWFYMMFALHIAYLIYSIVTVPFQHQRWCFTSFPIAIAAFDKAAVWLGAMYIVGAALWSLLLAYSLYVLREVYAVRKARGNKPVVAQPGV